MDLSVNGVSLPIFVVDSFTSEPFSGNPAAVALDNTENGLSVTLMQKIAAEMNLSETAFVRCVNKEESFSEGDVFELRWFTPTREVPLCGHGTMGAAAVLFFCQGNNSMTLTFQTLSGNLSASRRQSGKISLDLPLNPPSPVQDVNEWIPLLKLVISDVEGDIKEVQYSLSTKKLLVRLQDNISRYDLERLRPRIGQFVATRDQGDLTGIIVTIRARPSYDQSRPSYDQSQPSYDFFSRYFAPWNGIPEDPVTGSAHTVLAAYWSKELGNKTTLFARQCSARGGDLTLTLQPEGRLSVAGDAKVVLTGNIVVS